MSVISWFVMLSLLHYVKGQSITGLISTFSDELESLMCEGLRIGGDKCSNGLYGIQDFIFTFDDDFENDQQTNALIPAQSIIDRLDKKLHQRASFLRNISYQIKSECSTITEGATEALVDFDDLYFSGNIYKDSNLPDDIEYSEVYGNEVTFSASSFKVPNGVDIDNENVQRDAQISQLLDTTMMSIHEDYCVDDDGNHEYCSMYFGTVNGVFRQYPGVENPKSDGTYLDYDPRFRPWYVSAATGSKDVVILLDVSGSMRGGRISLAREAVVSVLNTLGSSSFVNVVAFSDEITLSCFGEELVPATARNIAELTTFVEDILPKGLTDFEIAFETAFNILETGQNCQTSIIFLTDGMADDPSSIIFQRNSVDINAVIFSYTLGDSANAAIPRAVAELTDGIYTHIDDADTNLITSMSSYYLYYAHGGGSDDSDDDIILTSPYLDFDTDFVMITMAIPVYVDDIYFVGVIGVDIPLSFLSDAIGDITIGRKSYSFVMNEESELLLHPLIPNAFQLFDSNSEYKAIFVDDVEPLAFQASIMDDMVQREDGMKRISATVKQSAGDVTYHGYIEEDVELLYIYGGVGPSAISIAIVIYSESDISAPKVPSFGMVGSPTTDCAQDIGIVYNETDLAECLAAFNLFHRLDIMTECNSSWLQQAKVLNGSDSKNDHLPYNSFYENKLYTVEYPIYYLQSGLFEQQYDALNVDPSCDELEDLHKLTNRLGGGSASNLPFGGIRSEVSANILNSIYTLTAIHEFWKPSYTANDSLFVSMYFGHYQGLHISYPGKQFSNTYNNQIRPWYQRAISYPDLMVWTTPYLHAVTGKLVTGGSTIIKAPQSDYAFGVAGFDYEYTAFAEYWKQVMSSVCDMDNKQACFLVDSSAFCLYYDGMEDDIDDEDISTKFFGDLEPLLMQSLIDREFYISETNVNFREDTIVFSYILNDGYNAATFASVATSFAYNNGDYTVHEVSKTNLFVIHVEGYQQSNQPPTSCPDHSLCSDVREPGCLTGSDDECLSATTDVCDEPDTTVSAYSGSASCTSNVVEICAFEDDDSGDMCAADYDGKCDDVNDDSVKQHSMLSIVCFVTVLLINY